MGRALIIGGSLGGLFAGLLLRQAGWDVTVFERSTGDLASRGVGIGTHVEMFEIMRRLGIVVDQSIGRSFSSRFCLAHDGTVIAGLPFDKILTSWTLLYRALRRQLPDACYRAGMQLEDIAQRESGVTAIFADGTRIEGDLLIGADGAAFDRAGARLPGGSGAGLCRLRRLARRHRRNRRSARSARRNVRILCLLFCRRAKCSSPICSRAPMTTSRPGGGA